jgi:hypothetical protein
MRSGACGLVTFEIADRVRAFSGQNAMKIQCSCGHLITDGGGGLGHKAHIIPDQNLFVLFDAIDRVLQFECATPGAREAACTRVRSLITQASRLAHSCMICGRLYIDGRRGAVHAYVPQP